MSGRVLSISVTDFVLVEDWCHLAFCRFLEYGEYKGNLYGTSIESVKDVLSSGKICVVDIEPNVSTTQVL